MKKKRGGERRRRGAILARKWFFPLCPGFPDFYWFSTMGIAVQIYPL
jgi:hypothetical protein